MKHQNIEFKIRRTQATDKNGTRQEWDHEINLMDEAPWELNAKAYAMTLKEEEALNQ